jgi:hypothetical protein
MLLTCKDCDQPLHQYRVGGYEEVVCLECGAFGDFHEVAFEGAGLTGGVLTIDRLLELRAMAGFRARKVAERIS